MTNEYLKLLRIKHYVKNLLVVLPLFFSGNLMNKEYFMMTSVGVVIFCLTSSIIYIINDINDIEKDRKHPLKAKRPLASKKVTIRQAIIIINILIIIIMILHLLTKNIIKAESVLILIIYVLMNVAYSIRLKNMPIIDITILAFGFLLRVLYGSFITGIPVSEWMYLTILTFSFYLGLGKRRNEIIKINNNDNSQKGITRSVLKYYSYNFLDKNMSMCLAITLVFYSLWTVNTGDKIGVNYLVWTVPLVIIICMKYSLIIEGDSYGDPVEVVFSDKILIILICLYGFMMFEIIYGKYLFVFIKG